MTTYIDEAYWRKALSKPTWYLLLKDDFDRLERLSDQEHDYDKRKQIKNVAYRLVEEAVRAARMPMAQVGPNLDNERQPIDTIVIHHTKSKPGMTLQRLNAIQLLRIYGRYFADPDDPKERHLKGQAVWSGHFYEDQQVFWCYHWLVRADGSSQRILDDSYIGWHAGNWDVNTRSVAICIDDDLSDTEPSDTVIKAIASTVQQHYPDVQPIRIVGHGEVNTSTECPGNLFAESWKQKLLSALQ